MDRRTQWSQSVGECRRDFCSQRLHGGDVHDFECILVDHSSGHVPPHLPEHRYHGDVGLTSACRRGDQDVFVAVEGGGVDAALDSIQCPAESVPWISITQLIIHRGFYANIDHILTFQHFHHSLLYGRVVTLM